MDPLSFYRECLVWDDHCGFSLQPGKLFSSLLKHWRDAGVDAITLMEQDPYYWPPGTGYDNPVRSLDVRRLPEVVDELVKIGFDAEEIAGILGENFRRVAEQVWR